MNRLHFEPSARQVLHNLSLINFSAFKVSLIPHLGEVICYIFSARNSFAIGSLHEMNHKVIHSMTDLL